MPIDQAKLKALKAQGPAKVGGQRVAKPAAKAEKTGAAADAAKVSQAVNRLGGKAIPGVSEVWMFVGNEQTLQFNNPKVTAAVQCNTWAITGKPVKKPVAECFTQALPHMGLDNMGALQQLLGAMGGMFIFNSLQMRKTMARKRKRTKQKRTKTKKKTPEGVIDECINTRLIDWP